MVVLSRFSAPTQGIKHQEPSTTLFVNGRNVGVGTLYIAESELSWKKNHTGEGISVLYPQVTLHGVSRDVERFGHECLYILAEFELNGELVLEDVGDDEERVSDDTELRFVPEDKGTLPAMYVAMNFCQALHPHPDVSDLSEDEGEDEFLDANEDDIVGADSGYAEGNFPDGVANGFHGEGDDDDDDHDSAMEIDPGQFEDAED